MCWYCINTAQFVSWFVAHGLPVVGEFCQHGGYTGECIKFLLYTELHSLLTAANQGTCKGVVFDVGDSSRGYTGQTHKQ